MQVNQRGSDDRRVSTQGPQAHEFLVAEVFQCNACRLCLSGGLRVVYRGLLDAKLMLVGEAPGEIEAQRGVPFVGLSGRLLSRIMAHAEVPEDRLYITNMVKCQPPANRDPTDDELRSCRSFLQRQLALVKPKVVLAAGRAATMALTATRGPMNVLLEQDDLCCYGDKNIPVVPMYHPAYLLRRLKEPGAREVFRDTLTRIKLAWQKANE